MAEPTVVLDLGEWQKFLTGVLGKMRDATATLLTLSKIHGFADIIQHFRDESGPDGRWPKRAPSTQERYRRIMTGELRPPPGAHRASFNPSNKLLQLTGALRQSITPTRGQGRKRGKNTVELFTEIQYAGVHQYGHRNIPARPFMWLSDPAKGKIVNDLLMYLVES